MRKTSKIKPPEMTQGWVNKDFCLLRGKLIPEANSNKRMEGEAENLKASESQYPFPNNKSVRNTAHTLWTQGNNKAESSAPFHALFKEKAIYMSFCKISVRGMNSTQE